MLSSGHASLLKFSIREAWIGEDTVRVRGGIYGSAFPDVVTELEKNHNQLALCPLTRDVAIDLKTLPAHGAVLKMTTRTVHIQVVEESQRSAITRFRGENDA